MISTELWEALNVTWNQLPAHALINQPHASFGWVRERATLVSGIIDSTISRDDTWNFLVLGRSVERADMTARLLTTRALAGAAGPDWTTLLRSCGAYEAYVRRVRGAGSDRQAAGFLLVDRLFPRSVVFALGKAEQCLTALDPHSDQATVDEARRNLGHARTDLEYRRLDEVLALLPERMENVQRACAAASNALQVRYFPSGAQTHWVGEMV